MNVAPRYGLILGLLASIGLIAAPCRAVGPQRIVSLNLCIDQILVDLVPHSRIAAVTHLAADPAVSAAPDRARGLPVTHGAAEDVIARNPDLVLASEFAARASVDLLRRLGLNVVIVPLPQDYDGVRTVVRQIATAVGEVQRGNAIVSEFDRRLQAAASMVTGDKERPVALVYQVNSYVSGTGTLVDAALVTAGFRNGASMFPGDRRGQVSIETVANARPDVLILSAGPDEYATAVSDNLRHPVLAKLMTKQRMSVLPWSLTLCGTPAIANAVEQLAQLRQTLPPMTLPPKATP